MQKPVPDRAWLLEICPASTLKQLKVDKPSYKGGRRAQWDAQRKARAGVIDRLAVNGLSLSDTARLEALDDRNGDALDSVVAAFAVFRSLLSQAFPYVSGDAGSQAKHQIEGCIYA
jgi:hypothetical protein